MFAIAFDLVVAETAVHHPKSVARAYADIGNKLEKFGFAPIQGSLYTNASEDLANLFAALSALRRYRGCERRCAAQGHSASSNGPISPVT